nr:MAG TPA: hypothetical protein [Caudoviricetes sp.]
MVGAARREALPWPPGRALVRRQMRPQGPV